MNLAAKKWVFLKISSVILLPLMFWFIINFVSIYDNDYSEVVRFFTNSVSKFFLNNLIFFFHYFLASNFHPFQKYKKYDFFLEHQQFQE